MQIRKPDECRDEFISYFKDNSIVPIVGSGISVGVNTQSGVVPSGSDYLKYMIDEIIKSDAVTDDEKKTIRSMSFSEVATLYEDDEFVASQSRTRFYRNNFSGAVYGTSDNRKSFFEIDWPYIYSLNIDDVIENSTEFKNVILPNREFNSEVFDNSKCLLKLHGDIREILNYSDGYKVFTSKEYASSLLTNRPMLNKLASDYGNLNMLFVGCSLSDEMDILALDTLKLDIIPLYKIPSRPSNIPNKVFKKNIILLDKEPSTLEKSRYKSYGITDVVVFDSFSDIYSFLFETWVSSTKVSDDKLDKFSHLQVKRLHANSSSNREYLYLALNPVDLTTGRLMVPYYMIERDCLKTILENIKSNTIQIVPGQRFSGKTYILSGLYKAFTDRRKYYFDGRVRLTDSALVTLASTSNALLLFDTDSLNRSQLQYLLKNHTKFRENNVAVVAMINSYDTELKGYVQMLRENGEISKDSYRMFDELFSNKFSKNELIKVNRLLPEMHLQPYANNDTLINYLMSISGEERIKTKYSDKEIPKGDVRELAFSIAIASNEVLYYSDIVNLEFHNIIGGIVSSCTPLIECLPTNSIERSRKDMSRIKYTLNSKYWIRAGLLELAHNEPNYESIIKAYKYLIERLIDFSKEDLNRRRNRYKKIIYFDTINDIFGGVYGGKRDLVAQIYTSLNDLLGTDYQYNHQRAKCLMRNAYYQPKMDIKEKSYRDAYESAKIAWKQVQNEYDVSRNEKLLISLAHIEYSLASISASLCDMHNYSDVYEIEEVIQKCHKAVINPYNEDDFYRDKKRKLKYGIAFFVRDLMDRYGGYSFSSETRNMYDELVERVLRNAN